MDAEDRLAWYVRRVRALERLLAHYRTASAPRESLLEELDATREKIDHRGNWRPDEMSDLHLP